jgi:hypothetical protein
MAANNRGSARRRSIDGGRSQTATTSTTEVAANTSSDPKSHSFDFADPVTGDTARATQNPDGSWVLALWKPTGRSWLFELAEAIGLRDALALKEDPRKYLAPFIINNVRRPTRPGKLPTLAELRDWHRSAMQDVDVMRYLELERGLTVQVVKRAGLGYDGRAITIPIYDARTRKLVNLRRRYWPTVPASGGKYQGLPGRTIENGGVTVYPVLTPGSLILVAGEFDALALQSNGLPGVSVTSGAATKWRQEWAWMVKGRRVAVLYDASPREQEQAISRAQELRQQGADDAWAVRLTEAGLSDGEDVTDWFVKYERTPADLLKLIKHERPRRRKGRRA